MKEQNGDLEVNSVTGTDGKLYGVPYTDNTWFMYYNKSKITEDEAKDFDTILSKAKVAFSLQNSWYINGFYDGLSLFGEKGNDADAGMVFPKDGADITSYLVDVVANPNFSNDDGASGLAAIKDGSADVLFSGTWSAKDVKEALVTTTPPLSADLHRERPEEADEVLRRHQGRCLQPERQEPEGRAAQFAAYLGSTEAQKLHYEMRAIPPTDKSRPT
ncbi:MAG: extracellular solute-binding protein [Bifidobacterium sp.]